MRGIVKHWTPSLPASCRVSISVRSHSHELYSITLTLCYYCMSKSTISSFNIFSIYYIFKYWMVEQKLGEASLWSEGRRFNTPDRHCKSKGFWLSTVGWRVLPVFRVNLGVNKDKNISSSLNWQCDTFFFPGNLTCLESEIFSYLEGA